MGLWCDIIEPQSLNEEDFPYGIPQTNPAFVG